MKSILNLHYRDHSNCGDMACAVSLWFQFKDCEWHTEDIHKAADLHVEDFAAVVIGGGGLLNEEWQYVIEDVAARNPNTFLWGVGTNTMCRRTDYRVYIPRNVPRSHVFLRDHNKDACPSLQHPLLKHGSNPNGWRCQEKPVGYVFGSALKPFPEVELPDNSDAITTELHFEEVLGYIRKKETVVTNSYHAALWSWRLGKKVVMVVPDRAKFLQLSMLSSGTIQFWSAWNPPEQYWKAIQPPATWDGAIDEPYIKSLVEKALQ